jgi:hypothetical protein
VAAATAAATAAASSSSAAAQRRRYGCIAEDTWIPFGRHFFQCFHIIHDMISIKNSYDIMNDIIE